MRDFLVKLIYKIFHLSEIASPSKDTNYTHMSLFIIDPIDDLPSALAGKNNIEKHQYLEMIFNVKIDKRIEEVGYWILLQNEK
jgi:hypothetical protein